MIPRAGTTSTRERNLALHAEFARTRLQWATFSLAKGPRPAWGAPPASLMNGLAILEQRGASLQWFGKFFTNLCWNEVDRHML